MANNPYVNKVVYGGNTLIDLTDTTAIAEDVAHGKYFYDASGAKVEGTAVIDLQEKTVTPTQSAQVILPDTGKDGLSKVTVNGDANLLAENIADGVTIFGITGTHKGGDIVIIGTNITVPIASWDIYVPATGTEEENIFDLGYQYRATVPLANVTSDMIPIIVWSLYTLDESGADLIDMYQCTTGGVYIYADTIPEVPILALTVECRKENI